MNTYTTKLKLGITAYFMHKNAIQTGLIRQIEINHACSPQGVRYRPLIIYHMDLPEKDGNIETVERQEPQVFTTKKELIDSL